MCYLLKHYRNINLLILGFQAFSRDTGLVTIETKDPKFQTVIGKSDFMSQGDIDIVNKMYRCGESGG